MMLTLKPMAVSLVAAKIIHRLRRLPIPNLCNLRNLWIDIGL